MSVNGPTFIGIRLPSGVASVPGIAGMKSMKRMWRHATAQVGIGGTCVQYRESSELGGAA